MTETSLKIKAKSLIQQQKLNWPVARTNYAGLGKVESKTFQFDGFQIIVQFNPERIRSSAAKTDSQSISERACFLCPENQPKEQESIDFNGRYKIQVNPYPIFNEHFTIPLKKHLPQEIMPHFSEMLQLSKQLPGYTVFYNGPKCGASAPDHFHFQAGNKNVMPVVSEIDTVAGNFGQVLLHHDQIRITAVGKEYLRKLILLESGSADVLSNYFQKLVSVLNERGQEGEPMMNVLCTFEDEAWKIMVFPRDKQRPSQFFAEGEKQILMSPASVEMSGLVILPRKEDFEKITKEDLADIYGQVTIAEAPSDSPERGEQEKPVKDWAWLICEIESVLKTRDHD